jgi:hypothetical protein
MFPSALSSRNGSSRYRRHMGAGRMLPQHRARGIDLAQRNIVAPKIGEMLENTLGVDLI